MKTAQMKIKTSEWFQDCLLNCISDMEPGGKEPACQRRCKMWVHSVGQEDPLQ